MIADITLSIDNMLAVGGASEGSLVLLVFGLAVSVPMVVLTSNLLSMLMDRYPVLIAIGAAVLGKVGTEMMLTDAWVAQYVHLGPGGHYAAQAAGAVGVLAVGLLLRTRAASRAESYRAEGLVLGSPIGNIGEKS